MGATERSRIAFEFCEWAEQSLRRRRREQRGKQKVLMRAACIDGIDSMLGKGELAFVVEIGAKFAPRNSRSRLNRNHTLSRHPVPVGKGGLGNANFSGKLGDTA